MSDYSAVAPPPQNFNQTTAFAAALQRAKQIAAKINPGSTQPDSRGKRPLEDGPDFLEPDAKKGPGLSATSQAPPPLQRPPQNQGGMNPPPMMGSGPQVNEDIKVPDKMVGLIIGRGGEQITRLQSESGCKIQMAPDSQGMPDRVCSLSGTKDAVMRAKELIMSIVHQRGRTEGGGGGMDMGNGGGPNGGPPNHNSFSGMNQGMGGGGGGPGGGGGGGRNFLEIMIPGPKVGLIIGKGGETIKQLQEKSGAKMVVIQDGPNQEQEKPLRISGDPSKVEYAKQLVYDLIAEKEMQNFGRRGPGGGGGGGGRDRGGQDQYGDYGGGNGGSDFEVLVPRQAVGVVIGKGGDMIKKIQAETGARVQFPQAREEGPGDRRCYLSGNPKQVEQARMRIEELIDSVHNRDNDGGGRGHPGGRGGGGRGGRGGRDGYDRGNSRNGGGSDYGGGGGGAPWDDRRQQGPPQEVTFTVPPSKCGVIIGRGGETIKQINQQSGAFCGMDRRASDGPNAMEKTFTIKGTPEQIEEAKRIISDKVQMPINFITTSGGGGGGMSGSMQTAYPGMAPQGYNPQGGGGGNGGWGGQGGGYQQPHQQQQQWGGEQPGGGQPAGGGGGMPVNSATGQPDYSMQWAEYYRSLGMHREAEMIEQQAKSKGGGAGGPGGPPAANGPAGGQPGAQQVAAGGGGAGGQGGGAAGGAGGADYSAQWAEYYRSIGKHKEAEAIESQMKNKGQGAAGGGGAAGGAAQPAGSYQQQQYGAYQAPAGYYGGQPQSGVAQGYSYPAYSYGGPGGGSVPSGSDN